MKLPTWIFNGYMVTDRFAIGCIVIGVLFIMLPGFLAILLEKGHWYSR